MTQAELPRGWGSDKITEFIDNARHNSIATYVNCRNEYNKLIDVDRIFRRLIDNLVNTKDWFVAFFLLRAHSAFLAGSHLAMAGQVVEAHASLRLCIENGLYGLYIYKNPESGETWLRRHDSDEMRKRVRDEFKIRPLLDTLAEFDKSEAMFAERLYSWCIDFGGHPNERALSQCLIMDAKANTVRFDIVYLSGNEIVLRSCLKTAARVGASVLGMFYIVFKERFDILGLNELLKNARNEL